MAAPPAQQTPPGYGQPAQPGYAQPAQSGYPPAGYGQSPPPGQWTPPATSRPMNMDMFSFLFRALGFILIAVGVLIVVLTGQFPGSCYSTTSTCGSLSSSNLSGMANAYIAGETLMALGALLLGLGAGIKLHWVLRPPADGNMDKMAWILVERVFNYGIIAISLIVFWWTLQEFSILATALRGFATTAGA